MSFLKENKFTLTIYFFLLVTASYFMLTSGKVQIHLAINKLVGNNFMDTFFFYITYLGDGLVAPFLILLILFYNLRFGVTTLLTLLLSTGLANLLKYTFYDDINRPWFVFQWICREKITYVPHVNLHLFNSFPSGHSTQAFAIFMCLSFFATKNSFKFLFLLLALLTAFSRTYLSQHWLVDISAGSIIGTGFAAAFYFFIIQKNKFQKLNRAMIQK